MTQKTKMDNPETGTQIDKSNPLKHENILEKLREKADGDPNTLGFLVFGSVATGTHHLKSDIDTITILRNNKPTSGMADSMVEGIKIGDIFFTLDVFEQSVKTVPYLLHPIGEANLLLDRQNSVGVLLAQIQAFFLEHPETDDEWRGYYEQVKEEKSLYGYEKTTIIDVWNMLESKYSHGKTRRTFFNAFYMRNQTLFSVIKKLLVSGMIAKEALVG